MSVLLSIEPEQGFFIVIALFVFIMFVAMISKFFQIAKDVREILELLKMSDSKQE